MDELAQKKAYAAALLRITPGTLEPEFAAALSVFGNDTSAALAASNTWPTDTDVIAEKARLIEEEAESFLPQKLEIIREVHALANNTGVEPKDRVAAYKLLAELRDWMPKKEAGTKVDVNVTNNRVMVVKDHGNDGDWEKKLAAQQAGLIREAQAELTRH